MAIINKVTEDYFDPELEGVIKHKIIRFLGIPLFELSSISYEQSVIAKFILNKRNKIGFNVEDKDKEIKDSETPADNQEGRLD